MRLILIVSCLVLLAMHIALRCLFAVRVFCAMLVCLCLVLLRCVFAALRVVVRCDELFWCVVVLLHVALFCCVSRCRVLCCCC